VATFVFLPFWLNTCLQHFCDKKALRIVERLLGLRPSLPTCHLQKEMLPFVKRKVTQLRAHAKQRGFEFGECLSLSALVHHHMLMDRCRFSGIPLAYRREKNQPIRADTPSFDRVNPSEGYFLNNVQVVAMPVNTLKSNLSHDGLYTLLNAIMFLKTPEFFESHIPGYARC